MTRLLAGIVFACTMMACSIPRVDRDVRINEIQVLGSHNSYKSAIDPSVMAIITEADSATARSLDYAHLPLDQQLDLGMRKFELDLFHDPAGGLYASPLGLSMVAKSGLPAGPPYDPEGVMRRPGLKVLHVQDIDFRSNHPTFKDCLSTMLAWSNRHPRHVPVFVMVECKTGKINRPGFAEPLPFTRGALDSVDNAILNVIPEHRIILPDEVRGSHETLEMAVRTGEAWPILEKARGRFLFFLLTGDERRALYVDGHSSLAGRVMFVTAPVGEPEAAVLKMDNPVRQEDEIEMRVREGYLVRTRADAGTRQARTGDRTRFEAALRSGAQIISTDYYLDDPRFDPEYVVAFPGGTAARPNPLLRPSAQDAGIVE